jgi:subtilisin family serine protease
LAYLRLTCVVFFGLLIGAAPGNVAVRQRVAIIDSGVARTPELGARIVAEYDLAAAPARPAFRPRYDHGTMVATILARANPAVDIVSLRIDDPAGCPPASNPPCQPDAVPIAAAIRRATALHVDAINISLALADDPAITTAVREAAEKGIVVVLAAGNDGLDRPANLSMARAAYPHAVLVGAVDAHGHPWSGTNRPQADAAGYRYVWRRGVDVPTALADGRQVKGTGTSFAAPLETARLVAQMRPLEMKPMPGR